MGFKNSQIETGTFLFVFQPPPHLGIFLQVALFFLMPSSNIWSYFQIVYTPYLRIHKLCLILVQTLQDKNKIKNVLIFN